MNVHNNARLTPKGRAAMIRDVIDHGLTKAEAARRLKLLQRTFCHGSLPAWTLSKLLYRLRSLPYYSPGKTKLSTSQNDLDQEHRDTTVAAFEHWDMSLRTH